MDKFSEVRRLAIDTAMEGHMQKSLVNNIEAKELGESLKNDTHEFNKILERLERNDREFAQSFLERHLYLRTIQAEYLYTQGLKDAFAICKNPAGLLLEETDCMKTESK